MTATVTQIQQELKTVLDGVANDSPPLPFAVRIANYDIADPTVKDGTADVVIGFESVSKLAHTNSSILEQLLIPVTVRMRMTKPEQTIMDANEALLEVLRDASYDYHSEAARAEDLIEPHPFDQVQAASGFQIARFVLDMDVIRRITSITQDSGTPAETFTLLRRAFWDAINNWSEWDGSTWARKFENDVDIDELALHDPGRFDLPAIAITPGPTNPQFFTHTTQEWPMTIAVTAWFPSHQLTLAEYRAWQIVRAIYQCKPTAPGSPTYIRTATGYPPKSNSPIAITPVELGRAQKLKAIKVSCTFVVPTNLDPRTVS